MTQTLTRSYDSYETARSVVEALEGQGVSTADISVVGRHESVDDSNTGEGAGIGAALGGAAGLLAGIGMIAIPGIGPVVAAGWLASTAAGAVAGGAAGGLIGAFTSSGHSEEDANYYAESRDAIIKALTAKYNTAADKPAAVTPVPEKTTAREGDDKVTPPAKGSGGGISFQL